MQSNSFYFWFWMFLIFGNTYSFDLLAQADTSAAIKNSGNLKDLFFLGVGVQHGFIFPHSQEVQNTKGARPSGLEVMLGWQSNDAPTWNLCNCFPRKGLLMTYYDFDNTILGKGATTAHFLEPTYRITKNTFLSFRGAAGLAYLSNPFDSITNPANQSYSTTFSIYLLFGAGAWFRLSEQWWLNPSLNYQHISNGGMQKPNKGINWPTAGLAISYQPQFRPYYTGVRSPDKRWKAYSPRWDVGMMGTSRRGYDAQGKRIRSPLIGIWAQTAKQAGRINNLTLGLEAYQDEELRNQFSKDTIAASSRKAGILVGHEFILGKFLFSQRLGYYIFNQRPDSDWLFHRWGLHYRVNRQIGVGFSLLAHRQVAEFIDFRISYSYQKKYR